MNPESLPAVASEMPGDAQPEAPLAARPAAPTMAPADAAPAAKKTDAGAEAPESMVEPPTPVRPTAPPELSPALLPSAVSIEGAAPAAEASPATPELSPAACGARLAELFPALFMAPGASGPAKPIKLRIHADIQARAPGVFTKRALGIFFSRYTTTNAYLKALATAPQRFDLDGQPAGEISDEHRQLAAEELARRHALAAERRAAQRPPRREVAPAAEGGAARGEKREASPERRSGLRPEGRPIVRPPLPQRDGDEPRSERASRTKPPLQSPQSPWQPRHADRPVRAARPERPPQLRDAAPSPALPMDPAQRERAMLLRSYESSPLSKANFCALKSMTEDALDAALEQAKAERGASSNAPARRNSGGS